MNRAACLWSVLVALLGLAAGCANVKPYQRGTLADYTMPSAKEIPEIEIHHRETISPFTLTGAKGLGEGGSIGAPAAIANAISDALSPLGVEILESPATPPRIRAAIRAAEQRA